MSGHRFKTVRCSTPPSDRLLSVCAAFSLVPEVCGGRGFDLSEAAGDVERRLAPGACVLVTGPSGSGKSSLLRALGDLLGDRAVEPEVADGEKPIIDALAGTVFEAMGALASVGLAEPALCARVPSELSEGQRARYAVAEALSRSRRGDTLLLDGFTEPLDALTGSCVARGVRRAAARAGVALVAATTVEQAESWLKPGCVVRFELPGAAGEPVVVIEDAGPPRGSCAA